MPGGAPKGNKNHYLHGGVHTRLYTIWKTMRQRCNNPNAQKHEIYHDRGISICDEWNDFNNFRIWAYSNGYAENLSIDRINNDDGYRPENCRWATAKEQSNNRRNTIRFECMGKLMTISEIADICGISYKLAYDKLKYCNFSPDELVSKYVSFN